MTSYEALILGIPTLKAVLPPVNSAAPAITGTAQVGQTLTINLGTWTGSPTLAGELRYTSNNAVIATFTANGTYTPVTGDVGAALYLHVTATNADGSATAQSTNTSTVIPAVPVFTDSAVVSSAYSGTPYSDGVSASNGGGTNTYALASGALPPGLSLNTATGAITGTPTTLGSYSFTISATNAAGIATTGTLTLQTMVNVFTQSLGSELLVNADFSAWTADNPTGWTVLDESGGNTVSQSAPNGSAGTGAAKFSSTATLAPSIRQTIGTAGVLYEWYIDVSYYASGSVRLDPIGGNTIAFASAIPRTGLQIGDAGDTALSTLGTTTHLFAVRKLSVKPITLNPIWVMPSPDSTHTLSFTLPVSPVAGQRIEMRYRRVDTLNYWALVLLRNAANTAWDVQLNSVSAGTATNRIAVTNVGTVDAIRIVTAGNVHTVYTGAGGVFTSRGSPVSNSVHAAATGITTVYSSPFTPLSLT